MGKRQILEEPCRADTSSNGSPSQGGQKRSQPGPGAWGAAAGTGGRLNAE
jgi:hypothetical protein